MSKKKKVISKKTYTIELIEYSDGTCNMKRVCDGFNALELLGLCHSVALDIGEQTSGLIKPDVIKRTIIED